MKGNKVLWVSIFVILVLMSIFYFVKSYRKYIPGYIFLANVACDDEVWNNNKQAADFAKSSGQRNIGGLTNEMMKGGCLKRKDVCSKSANSSGQYYVVFKGGISAEDATKTLNKYGVTNVGNGKMGPDYFKFKLNDNEACAGLQKIYESKDTFRIPGVLRDKNIGTESRLFEMNCPGIPKIFINQNGAIQPSNTFLFTFYENKDKINNLIKEIKAFEISGGVVSEKDKEKTFYVKFENNLACENIKKLSVQPFVKTVGEVPYMPTVGQ